MTKKGTTNESSNSAAVFAHEKGRTWSTAMKDV